MSMESQTGYPSIVPSSSLVELGVPDQYALHMRGAGYILASSVTMYPG